MEDFGLRPEPPSWALEAGLPEPLPEETFVPYVQRLGLEVAPLLADLTQQTIVLANGRLATTLARCMRTAFDRHVDQLARKHLTPQRRKEIQRIACNTFGARYRHPMV